MKQIVIKNVQDSTKSILTNIAKNRGMTVSAMLRKHINEVIRSAKDSEKRSVKD